MGEIKIAVNYVLRKTLINILGRARHRRVARGQRSLGEIFLNLAEFCLVNLFRVSQRIYLVEIKI